jgi:hypothetical protein
LVKRKTNSPWGSAYKEGLPSTAVNDRIEVDEILYPSVNTGNIDVKTGQWEGITLSDNEFTIDARHDAVANGATVLSPQTTPDYINMTGYSELFIALRPSNAGNIAITAVMGPAHNSFANLSPVNAATTLRGGGFPAMSGDDMDNVLLDAAEDCTADVWNIFYIHLRVMNQKLLQFKLVNNSGGESNIDFAYLRSV